MPEKGLLILMTFCDLTLTLNRTWYALMLTGYLN